MTSRPRTIWILLISVLLLLSACTTPTPTASLTVTPLQDNTEVAATDPAPAASPTVAVEQYLWVHAPESNEFAPSLQAASASTGYTLTEQDSLPEVLPDGVHIVIVEVDPDGRLPALAQSSPEVHFIAAGLAGIQPSENISVLNVDRSHAAFVAGLITQMISPDFRGGGLFSAGDPRLGDAFVNGGRYLCGRCTPIFAPVVMFPVAGFVEDASRPENWTAAFNTLDQNRLESLFIPAEAGAQNLPDFLAAVGSAEVQLLGEIRPEGVPDRNWIATVDTDTSAALDILLNAAAAGEFGQQLIAPVVLEDINQDVLTPGKMKQVQQAIDELASGYLHPLSIPLE